MSRILTTASALVLVSACVETPTQGEALADAKTPSVAMAAQGKMDKIEVCHRMGTGLYKSLMINGNAEPAHRAHGDGQVGDPVPRIVGFVFGPDCQPVKRAIVAPDILAYVTSSSGVTVIDTRSHTVVATMDLGSSNDVAFSPSGSVAYVLGHDALSVVETVSHSVVATIEDIAGKSVAVTPDGDRLYVLTWGNAVYVVDTAANSVVDRIPVTFGNIQVAVAPTGTFAYVTHGGGSSRSWGGISVIETSTNELLRTFGVGTSVARVAFSPDGAYAYVALDEDGGLAVIDTSNHTVVRTVPVGTYPTGIALTSNGGLAYVTDIAGSPYVHVLDMATESVVATAGGAGDGWDVALTPDDSFAYVVANGRDAVVVVETASNTVVGLIPVGRNAFNLAIMPRTVP